MHTHTHCHVHIHTHTHSLITHTLPHTVALPALSGEAAPSKLTRTSPRVLFSSAQEGRPGSRGKEARAAGGESAGEEKGGESSELLDGVRPRSGPVLSPAFRPTSSLFWQGEHSRVISAATECPFVRPTPRLAGEPPGQKSSLQAGAERHLSFPCISRFISRCLPPLPPGAALIALRRCIRTLTSHPNTSPGGPKALSAHGPPPLQEARRGGRGSSGPEPRYWVCREKQGSPASALPAPYS